MVQVFIGSIVVAFTLLTLSPADGLQDSVEGFWEAMSSRDKVAAMGFVHPQDLNNFLNTEIPNIKDWKVKEVSTLDYSRSKVTVSFSSLLLNGATYPIEYTQEWVLIEDSWRVRIPEPKTPFEVTSERLKQQEQAKPIPVEVSVYPELLRFFAIAPSQPANLYIRNGLQTAVTVVDLKIGDQRFDIVEIPSEVAPGETARIKLRCMEKGEELNQEAVASLVLRQGTETTSHQIRIIYNYLDEVSAWVIQQQQKKGKAP